MIISAFRSFYDHWESIKNAFKTDGILGGLKRIGLVLLDALLKPIQSLLELLAKIPRMSNLAGKGAAKIEAMRQRMNTISPNEVNSKQQKLKKLTTKPTKTQNNENLYATGDFSGDYQTPKFDVGADINKTVGASNQVKNITVNIDALVKDGGINISQNETKNMTLQQIEQMITELLMRSVVNFSN